MRTLGLDIGTTSISAVVMEGGCVLSSRTAANDSRMAGCAPWERIQNPVRILSIAKDVVHGLLTEYPDVQRIGVTGQQHGIVYLDASGHPVSPLYTWQDGRGDLPLGDCTYCGMLQKLTGYPVATGYGMVTHFYHVKNHSIPENAVTFCTIHDLAAMVLAGKTAPAMDGSDAASFGLFDLKSGSFDWKAVLSAGINPDILPELSPRPRLGIGALGIPVYTAIGDNQASFLGATGGETEAMLVNIGTGSQFSVHVPDYVPCPGLQLRPFPLGGFLLVGAALCGGQSYALLESFFRRTAEMVTGKDLGPCYDAMDRMLRNAPKPASVPEVHTLFQGSRADPNQRGSITNIGMDNLTPEALTWGMMAGMSSELYEMYGQYLAAGGKKLPLYGSGNGLRKNRHLCGMIEELFDVPMALCQYPEEAACGAALLAGRYA